MGCCGSTGAAPVNPNAIDMSHFELLKVVGKGGFGKVNAVEHRVSGQLYALKTIEKALLLKNDSNRSTVWMEREVMARFRSNFLVHLKYAFQDKSFLYLVMNFMKGGDLRFHLDNHGPLSEERARFYMAEILLGLQEMNSLGIVYRDLKPENVLLDENGHLRISDFGLCSQLKADRGWMTYGESGTPGYLAPEVLLKQKYNTSQDVWSFGVVLFEFLHNHLPFDVNNRDEVISGDFRVKSSLSAEAKDLLRGLLAKDPNRRLGMGARKWEEVKGHPWFSSIDWKKADDLKLAPPFMPDPEVANCSSVFDLEDQLLYVHKDIEFSPAEQKKFEGFEYNTNITPDDLAAMAKLKAAGGAVAPGAANANAGKTQSPPPSQPSPAQPAGKNLAIGAAGPMESNAAIGSRGPRAPNQNVAYEEVPSKRKVMLTDAPAPNGVASATAGPTSSGNGNGSGNGSGPMASESGKLNSGKSDMPRGSHGSTMSAGVATTVNNGNASGRSTNGIPTNRDRVSPHMNGLNGVVSERNSVVGVGITGVHSAATSAGNTPSAANPKPAGYPLFVTTANGTGNGNGLDAARASVTTATMSPNAIVITSPGQSAPGHQRGSSFGNAAALNSGAQVPGQYIPQPTNTTSPSVSAANGIAQARTPSVGSLGLGGADAATLAATLATGSSSGPSTSSGTGANALAAAAASASANLVGDPNAVNGNPNSASGTDSDAVRQAAQAAAQAAAERPLAPAGSGRASAAYTVQGSVVSASNSST